VFVDQGGDLVALGEQLVSVVLRDDALAHVVHQIAQHDFNVVGSDGAVDFVDHLAVWLNDDPDAHVDDLQVFGSSLAVLLFGYRLRTVDVRRFNEGNGEIDAFEVRLLLQSSQLVELDCHLSRLHLLNAFKYYLSSECRG